jgi:amidohydrolase
MTTLIPRIRELARVYHAETIAIRRHIHAHPELSGEEAETMAFVGRTLEKFGVPFRASVGGYGIVADIRGTAGTGGCVALRADMDALPIVEPSGKPYASVHAGVMHACGHDAHTAALLGAAHILSDLKEHFRGTVRLIFQPSEERFPGGAKAMIEDGALQNPVPDMIYGAHVFPDLPAGMAGMRPGPYMASTDEVYLTVKGRGGHAATPDINVDPVVTAAQILVALQQVASRLAPPAIPTVLSFGRFIADGQTNIIPHEVTMAGTLRTFDEAWRARAHEAITRIAQKTAESMGGSCEVFIDKGYPFLVNDPKATSQAMELAKTYLGDDKVVELGQRMTAEDFAYYAQKIPACFYRIGVRNEEKGITANLHTPEFDIDEKSLEPASGLLAWLATGTLENL